MTSFTKWKCTARPASTGKTCNHMNKEALTDESGRYICAACLCTKEAGDKRARHGMTEAKRRGGPKNPRHHNKLLDEKKRKRVMDKVNH